MEAKLGALREAAQSLDGDIRSMKDDLRVEMQRLDQIDPNENLIEAQNYERQEEVIRELKQEIEEAEAELRGLGEEIQAEISKMIKIEAQIHEETESADMATRMDIAYLDAMGFDALSPSDAEYLFTEISRVSAHHGDFPFDLVN